jgi:hypothetical protein
VRTLRAGFGTLVLRAPTTPVCISSVGVADDPDSLATHGADDGAAGQMLDLDGGGRAEPAVGPVE